MDFRQAFINSLHSNIALTKTISLLDYLPEAFPAPDPADFSLPYLQAYARIQASFPYYYEISQLNTCCLLYTETGTGNLIMDNCSQQLLPNTLAIIDCNNRHRIEIKQHQWNYIVFFVNGNMIFDLHRIIAEQYNCVFQLSDESAVPNMLKKFFNQLELNDKAFSYLQTKIILDILLEIAIEKESKEQTADYIPDYLTKIKHNFDTKYQNDYSLNSLEQDYHICKYRICREFTKHYNISPIQYLNMKRIEAAKEALLYTDKRINEIGRMVGFENINLLIRLFKKYTGTTPFNYRKKSPEHTLFN